MTKTYVLELKIFLFTLCMVLEPLNTGFPCFSTNQIQGVFKENLHFKICLSTETTLKCKVSDETSVQYIIIFVGYLILK